MSEPGRAGWTPPLEIGIARPLPLGGLVRGGWSLGEGDGTAEGLPFPGLFASRRALAAYDSLTISPGIISPHSDLRDGLTQVEPAPLVYPGGKPRSVFGAGLGDFGVNESLLSADRGDARGHVHIEVRDGNRAAAGPYGLAARHLWSVGLAKGFGANEFSIIFRQTGLAAEMLAGEHQSGRGASGVLGWQWKGSAWSSSARLSRQWDEHESYGGTLDPLSHRDAQDVRAFGTLEHASGEQRFGAGVDWSRSRVVRSGGDAFEATSEDAWVKAWWNRQTARRHDEVEVGWGHSGGSDEYGAAPRARVEWTLDRSRLSVWGARVLTPAWADLAPGQRPFLQSTWALGADAQAGSNTSNASLSLIAGRTQDRILLARLPLEEEWLREGQGRDPDPWEFGVVVARVRRTMGRWLAIGEGSATIRDDSSVQARVDPALTGRLEADYLFKAFKGDLAVRVGAQLDGIGPRQTDEAVPQDLSAITTFGMTLGLAISEFVVTIRARDLENRIYEDVWIDPTTGRPARGLGREIMMSVACKIFN
ncbi:MAG TPA: hypothetical protein VMJ70_07375 [Candidatus Sulfotelmatobacter sp.]|nr:hypothetical protein [Candidatus Sulfotelmatobacter sp.]